MQILIRSIPTALITCGEDKASAGPGIVEQAQYLLDTGSGSTDHGYRAGSYCVGKAEADAAITSVPGVVAPQMPCCSRIPRA